MKRDFKAYYETECIVSERVDDYANMRQTLYEYVLCVLHNHLWVH